MTADWKDILAGLGDSMPAENDNDADTTSAASAADAMPDRRPTLTVFFEKKGRAGKPATILTGFDPDSPAALDEADRLAATLKKRLGCGGSSRGGEILLQGDRRPQLRSLLPSLGYRNTKGL